MRARVETSLAWGIPDLAARSRYGVLEYYSRQGGLSPLIRFYESVIRVLERKR